MEKSDDVAKVRQVKSLLQLIQQLHVEPETVSAAPQAVENPYIQHWLKYQASHRAGADVPLLPAPRSETHISPWIFVLATLLNTTIAAVLGVLITLSVVRQEPPRASNSQLVDLKPKPESRYNMTVAATPPPATPVGPIEVQPIGSRERPLRLQAAKPARLPLRIQPEEASAETFIMVLSGAPAKTDVQGAERIGSDSWLLGPQSIGNLMIMLPEWSSQTMEIGLELRRTNGALAGRTTAWIAVPPPPMPQVTSEGNVDQTSLNEILQRGDRLLSRGDIVAARALYARAAEMGSAQAALALGSTYDPGRLWSLGVFGMVGSNEKARHWYTRAEDLGHPGAKERLRALAE